MAPVVLESQADCERLVQFLYEALATTQQRLNDGGESSAALHEALEKLTARWAAILRRCVTDSHSAEVAGQEDADALQLQELDAQKQALLAEIETTNARVEKLRKDVPARLAQKLVEALEQARPLQNAEAVPMEVEPEQRGTLNPQPETLQLVLTEVSQKLPALRAKLNETVGRLKRVTDAISAEDIKPLTAAGSSENKLPYMLQKQLASSAEFLV